MEKEENIAGKAVGGADRHREALEAWMRRNLPEHADLGVPVVDIPRSTGFSNETVVFSAHWSEAGRAVEKRFVARIEQEDGGLFPDQTPQCPVSVDVQRRMMQLVAEREVAPGPRVVAYEAERDVLGRPFFVMEYVDGEIPGDVPLYTEEGFLVDRAGPAERERLVWDGLDHMIALGRIDWREAGLDWLDASGDGRPGLSAQLALYRSYVTRELDGRTHPVLEACLDWLEHKAPDDASAPVGVSWGDARIGNMIWKDYRCVGVLDWEAAALLPAEADLGWWMMYDRMAFDDKGIERLAGYPDREAMLARWEVATGRSPIGGVDYWEIFAAMRFDAIMIRLGDRLVKRGYLPPEGSIAIENGTTEAVARLLARQGVQVG